MTRWVELRRLAVAAAEQLATGPREWPGTPSRQRLELFLALPPDVVIALLDELEERPSDVPAVLTEEGQLF